MKKIILAGLSAATLALSLPAADTLATVNGHKITKEDVQAVLNSMGARTTYDALPDEIKKKVLNQIIEQQLLQEKALKSGIEKSKEYKEALEKLKKKLALDIWMKKQLDQIKVSEKEAKKLMKSIKMHSSVQRVFMLATYFLKQKRKQKKLLKS